MLQIFNGSKRGPGGAGKSIYIQLDVSFRSKIKHFKYAQLATFLAIALHMDKDGVAFPSYDTLERETGYKRGTVAKALKDLCQMEIDGHPVLMKWRVRDKDGKFTGSNRYKIFPTAEEVQSSKNPTVDKLQSSVSELEVVPSCEEDAMKDSKVKDSPPPKNMATGTAPSNSEQPQSQPLYKTDESVWYIGRYCEQYDDTHGTIFDQDAWEGDGEWWYYVDWDDVGLDDSLSGVSEYSLSPTPPENSGPAATEKAFQDDDVINLRSEAYYPNVLVSPAATSESTAIADILPAYAVIGDDGVIFDLSREVVIPPPKFAVGQEVLTTGLDTPRTGKINSVRHSEQTRQWHYSISWVTEGGGCGVSDNVIESDIWYPSKPTRIQPTKFNPDDYIPPKWSAGEKVMYKDMVVTIKSVEDSAVNWHRYFIKTPPNWEQTLFPVSESELSDLPTCTPDENQAAPEPAKAAKPKKKRSAKQQVNDTLFDAVMELSLLTDPGSAGVKTHAGRCGRIVKAIKLAEYTEEQYRDAVSHFKEDFPDGTVPRGASSVVSMIDDCVNRPADAQVQYVGDWTPETIAQEIENTIAQSAASGMQGDAEAEYNRIIDEVMGGQEDD